MKKYYFADGMQIACDGMSAETIKKYEKIHGELLGVAVVGKGFINVYIGK